nr:uncharacterized protein LOC129284133 [Lytechinus pictus]
MSQHVDILALTETWLTGDERDGRVLSDFSNDLPSHQFISSPRIKRSGGGVGVCLHRNFTILGKDFGTLESFEYLNVLISAEHQKPLRLVVIYRPQRTIDRRSTSSIFLDEFATFLEGLASEPNHLVICGDFNFHVNDDRDREAVLFLDLISSANLIQHIDFPTHRKGHTLDLILTRASDDVISNVSSSNFLPSDHSSVSCHLNVKKPDSIKIEISFRKLKDIDIQAFREDILESELYKPPAYDIEQQVVQYNMVLQALLDKHAPLITRCVTARPHSRWFTDDLRKSKQRVRRLERRYRHSKAEIDRQILKDECRLYSNQLAEAKTEYYSEQLDDCDAHQLFQRVDRLSSTSARNVLPSDDDPHRSLANRFSNFFSAKIDVLVRSLESVPSSNLDHVNFRSTHHRFNAFSPVTQGQVHRVIKESRSTSTRLDPIPTWLLKNCINELTPVITAIVNASLINGHFPDSLKHAHVTPLLKSTKLSSDDLKSYRPVSNLQFLGKTVETCVKTTPGVFV